MEQIQLLKSLLVQEIFDTANTSSNFDFKVWVANSDFLVNKVVDRRTVELYVRDVPQYASFLTSDACRFACAAIESIVSVQKCEAIPHSKSWLAIKSYYAAFFAAHSVLRCFGFNSSQLERGHLQIIDSNRELVGLPTEIKLEKGFFNCEYDRNHSILKMKKAKNSHEDTWSHYNRLILELSNKVLTVPGVSSKKQALSAELTTMSDFLCDRGRLSKGNKLSEFRNSINYKHSHSAWWPERMRGATIEEIIDVTSRWKQVSSSVSGNWGESREFCELIAWCSKIVGFCYQLMCLIAKESDHKKSPFSELPLKLAKICKAA